MCARTASGLNSRGVDANAPGLSNEFYHGRAYQALVKDTTSVGRYRRGYSPFGCSEMAGNVREWTASLYRDYPYRDDDGRNDPKAEGSRVLRGGSWYDNQGDARCARRRSDNPNCFNNYTGFRVAVSLSASGF